MERRGFSRTVWAWVAVLVLGAGGAVPAAEEPAAPPAAEAAAPAEKKAGEVLVVLSDDGTVTLSAVNASAKAVINALSEKTGRPIRMEPESEAQVSLTLVNQPFEQLLVAVAQAITYTPSRCYLLSPRQEGQELPDRQQLPEGLPTVSLTLARPASVAGVVAALRAVTQLDIEAAEGLKGEATLQVTDVPLPEVLDSLCKQLNAVWRLGYRLKSAATGTAAPTAADAEAARQEMEAWAEMTEEERQFLARQHTGNLLRADPAERKRQISTLVTQLRELSRALAPLTGEERAKMAKAIEQRAAPYLRELEQLPREQRRDFQPVIQAFQRVMAVAKTPPAQGGRPAEQR